MDGLNWGEATPAADFSVRAQHAVAVFDDKLWVVGGLSNDAPINDIWFSTDGIN